MLTKLKSSLIRHLISTSKVQFKWLDQSMLVNINRSDFLEYLFKNKNSVFVLEDCEILLQSRDQGGNGLISSLLNISDGILGDSLNIKFICTFNTNLRGIDKALLRKGRMKLKYEVKELTVDKANKLLDKLKIKHNNTKALSLAEIYNYTEDNGNVNTSKKLGF